MDLVPYVVLSGNISSTYTQHNVGDPATILDGARSAQRYHAMGLGGQ